MRGKRAGDGENTQSPGAAAYYIASLVSELAQLATGHRLDGLAYILDMARLEAEQIAKASVNSNGGGG